MPRAKPNPKPAAVSPTCVSVSPETDPPPSPDDPDPVAPMALSCIVASLTRIETTLGSMERALDAVRGVCAVNAELTAANVAMRANGAVGPAGASANGANGANGPVGTNGASNGASNGSSSRVVTYIVGAADVALVGNEHTFDMRSTLKAADAKWNSAPPARWVVPSAAWSESRAAWETTFGVSFVERASV